MMSLKEPEAEAIAAHALSVAAPGLYRERLLAPPEAIALVSIESDADTITEATFVHAIEAVLKMRAVGVFDQEEIEMTLKPVPAPGWLRCVLLGTIEGVAELGPAPHNPTLVHVHVHARRPLEPVHLSPGGSA